MQNIYRRRRETDSLLSGWAKLTIVLFCVAETFALMVVCNAAATDINGQDIITKSKNGDLLTSPPKSKAPASRDALTSGNTSNNKGASKKTGSARLQEAAQATPTKPDKDYLDVYIGRCQYTAEALSDIRHFASQHPNIFIQFYSMKTRSEVAHNAEAMKGIEIYLPTEAKRFDITTVPAFILNTKGKTYKISGSTELTEFYQKIQSGNVKGERKSGYVDLGDQGRGCPAVIPDLRPSAFTPSQKAQIAAQTRQPDMRGVLLQNRVSMQETPRPVYLERQAPSGPIASKFIVFSERQTEWARSELKKGKAAGCCTDCLELSKVWPHAQYCSKDLLTKLGVSTVPTIVTFHSLAH